MKRLLLCLPALALACGQAEEPEVRPSAAPVQAVAEPKVEETPEVSADEAKAMQDALMGLNKPKPEAQPVEEVAAKPVKKRVVRRRRPEPVEEDPYPMGPTTLTQSEFGAVASNFTGVSRCLATVPSRDPNRSGVLRLKFHIPSDGHPDRVSVVERKGAMAERIEDCVVRRAKRLSFPSFEGEPAEHTAKFVF